MISIDRAGHNAGRQIRRWLPLLAGLPAFLLLATGCGGDGRQAGDAKQDGQDAVATPCPAVLDTTAWQTFRKLGDRFAAGEAVTDTELEAYGNLPAVTVWRQSMAENVPPAFKIGNWVEGAFQDFLPKDRPVKQSGDLRAFGGAMRFSYDHRAALADMLRRFGEEGHTCRTYELARRWVEPENLPDPFTIHFVPGKAELRSHHGQLVADTGLLLAGGPAQLDRQLVGILYRDRQALPGDNPLDAEGELSVANTIRIMLNEGTAAWIDDMAHTHFNNLHPRLRKVSFVPENIYNVAIRGMNIFNTNLPRLLDDPEAMQASGQHLSRAITGAGALTQGGYAMAAVIVHRLGEERLHAVRKSPAAFLEAYQEAALQNTLPLPTPGEVGTQLPETMPAFSDEVYAGLLAIVEKHFPRV